MRKTMLVAVASVFGICVLVIAAKAATTWQGPPTNCTSPEGSSCNTNGVIWNQTTQQSASFNVSGTGRVSSGLTVDAGEINTGNSIFLKPNGDIWLTDGKSIAINQAGTSHLLMGNWNADAVSKMELTLFGDLKIYKEVGGTYTPKLYASNMCLGPEGAETCITSWPVAGGGGDITGVTAGAGLTGGGLNGDVTLSVSGSYQLPQACTNGQVAKSNGAGAWNCAADSAGTGDLTDVIAGTGVTVTNPGGPQPTINVTDNYVNTAGDTMTGQLTISRADATWPSISAVNGIQSNSFVQFYNQLSINSPGIGVYAAAPTAGSFSGTAYGVVAYAEPGGSAGYFANKPSGMAITKRVELATVNNAVEAILGNIKVNPGNSICFDADCRNSWSSVSGITGATANGGLVVNGSSLGMLTSCAAGQLLKWNGAAWACAGDLNSGVDNYVNTTGDTMTGGLTISSGQSLTLGGVSRSTWPLVYGGNGIASTQNADMSHSVGLSNAGCGVKGTWEYNSPSWSCVDYDNRYIERTGDAVSGTYTITGSVITTGASNALTFSDRTVTWPTQWSWLATGGIARLNNNLTGEKFTFQKDGQLQLSGSTNGYYFNNRTAATQWGLYSDNIGGLNAAALWSGSNKFYINTNGQAWKANLSASWDNPSDERLKDIHGNFTAGLKEIMQLQPIKFTYKKDNPLKLPSDVEAFGFSAQAVKKVLPEAVTTDGMGYLNLKTDPILWAEVNAIKELKVQNDMLQAENDMLLHRIEALEAKVN